MERRSGRFDVDLCLRFGFWPDLDQRNHVPSATGSAGSAGEGMDLASQCGDERGGLERLALFNVSFRLFDGLGENRLGEEKNYR